jgi:hypothetical protein
MVEETRETAPQKERLTMRRAHRALDRSRPLAIAAAVIALTAATAAAQRDGEQEDGFTETERRALVAGELVRRDQSRRERLGHVFGGTSWQRIPAPIDRVWRTAIDPDAYTRLIPSLDRVRVVRDTDAGRVLYMHHSFGISEIAYHITMRIDHASHSLRFDLDRSRPTDLRSGRGFLTLRPYRGDTIMSWGMLADPGGGLISQLFGPMLPEWLLLPPSRMRAEMAASPSEAAR